MKEVTIEQIMEMAKDFQKQQKEWHFHMLTPDCKFNQRKDKQAFVLENRTDNDTYVTYSDTRYMEQGQILVKMLHGESIVSNEDTLEQEDENIQKIVLKAKELNEKGVKWHHHMFFPSCEFNERKGKWCIVFEDKETDEVIESFSENEPKEKLRKIEGLYYNQKS